MINWFDMPAEGLSNGGLFEIKELTATENKVYQKDGEVYNKVTVNVEGGGGSSDFSTAEVTIISTNSDAEIYFDGMAYNEEISANVLAAIVSIGDYWRTEYAWEGAMNETVEFVKFAEGFNIGSGVDSPMTATGNATVTFDEEYGYTARITGDCTITIS